MRGQIGFSTRRLFMNAAAAGAALAAPAGAAAQSTAKASSDEADRREPPAGAGGFSPARLARMHDILAGYVERGEVPGLATLVSRRGETHVETIGMKAAGGSDPVRRDTIFRIASMSKPVTAAAAMILVEECKLRLDQPVDRWLPELANRKVLKRLDGPLDDTVPAKRPITVRDLLTFRMGIGLLLVPPDRYPILQAMKEQKVDVGPFLSTAEGPDAWMRGLGSLPLMAQPGERWLYHTGAD